MYVLLVTWFAFNQPPVNSQMVFASAQACEVARKQVIGEGVRLKREQEQEVERLRTQGIISNPGPPPRVSAVCIAK
jgi:hypothetical protein